MSRVRTVNMSWERRFRGAYPASRFALGDDGVLTLAVPRPLAARTFDLTRIDADGAAEIRSSFAVETLSQLQLLASSDNGLGMTTDDVYLFQSGAKSRFLGERHVTFIDIGLSENGERVAVALSDIAGASYALAFGDIRGHVDWLLDVDSALTSVAIARDGRRIAFGSDNGAISLVNAGRRDLWQFEQEAPIASLACTSTADGVLYATSVGGLGLIDLGGSRRWTVALAECVDGIGIAGDGALAVALSHPEGDEGSRIRLLDSDGRTAWDFELSREAAGLSVSPNGLWFAVSGRDGFVTLFNVVLGTEASPASFEPLESAAPEAERLAESGDLEGAYLRLRESLAADPSNLKLFDAFDIRRAAWREWGLETADGLAANGSSDDAIGTLEAMAIADPRDSEILARLSVRRVERAADLLNSARSLLSTDDDSGAEAAILAAIDHDPLLREARQLLDELHSRLAAEALANADALLARGELDAGVSALERARNLRPSAEITDRLRRAQTGQEFAAGLAMYAERRYREAIFQFQKVLARDPAHREATKHLGYAESLLRESAAGDIADRFSRLE